MRAVDDGQGRAAVTYTAVPERRLSAHSCKTGAFGPSNQQGDCLAQPPANRRNTSLESP